MFWWKINWTHQYLWTDLLLLEKSKLDCIKRYDWNIFFINNWNEIFDYIKFSNISNITNINYKELLTLQKDLSYIGEKNININWSWKIVWSNNDIRFSNSYILWDNNSIQSGRTLLLWNSNNILHWNWNSNLVLLWDNNSIEHLWSYSDSQNIIWRNNNVRGYGNTIIWSNNSDQGTFNFIVWNSNIINHNNTFIVWNNITSAENNEKNFADIIKQKSNWITIWTDTALLWSIVWQHELNVDYWTSILNNVKVWCLNWSNTWDFSVNVSDTSWTQWLFDFDWIITRWMEVKRIKIEWIYNAMDGNIDYNSTVIAETWTPWSDLNLYAEIISWILYIKCSSIPWDIVKCWGILKISSLI